MSKLIIENGGLNIRVGFTTSNLPDSYMLNKAIRMPIAPLLNQRKNYFCGEEAEFLSQNHNIQNPIKYGKIENWDLQFSIWDELFEKLSLNTSNSYKDQENSLYIITSMNYTYNCYSKMMNFIFDEYNVNSLNFGIDCVNALYSKGLTTGVVLDSGHSFTRIMPIFQGHVKISSLWQMDYGGNNVSSLISKNLVNDKNEKIYTQRNIDYLKKNVFYHKLIEDEKKKNTNEKIILPDGRSVEVGEEAYKFVSGIFEKRGDDNLKMVDAFWNSLNCYDKYSKSLIMQNIFFTGGNTGFKNFKDFFRKEFKDVAFENSSYNFVENEDILNSCFKGSSLVYQYSGFEEDSIQKKDWQEIGDSIIFRKKSILLL